MKIISLVLLICLTVSCAKQEHSTSPNREGVVPNGTIPETGSYNTCDHQNAIFGSFAFAVGDHNMRLVWNRYSDPSHASQYRVVVKDRHGNVFTSPLTQNNSIDIHHSSIDQNGRRLGEYMRLEHGQWYWVDLEAYTNTGQKSYSSKYEHIIRGKDIQLNYGDKVIEAGFCGNNRPYGF